MTAVVNDPTCTTHSPRGLDLDREIEAVATAMATAADPAERAELEEQLVIMCLPAADALARRYAGRGIETEDLLQVARTALVKAAQRYRLGRGAGFGAFLAPTVSGEIKRWFRDHGWAVRPPRRLQELRSRLALEEEDLRGVLARNPHDDELAAAMGVTPRDVDEVRRSSRSFHAASLDALTSAGDPLLDHLGPATCPADSVDLLSTLGWAVSRLSARQRRILRLRFVEELTQQEIGRVLGVSQMQVSRLLRAIVDQLRRDLEIESAVVTTSRSAVRP